MAKDFVPCEKWAALGMRRGLCWNMTLAEYLAFEEQKLREVSHPRIDGCLKVARKEHLQEVIWAVQDGLSVRAEVLAEYPHLVPEPELSETLSLDLG